MITESVVVIRRAKQPELSSEVQTDTARFNFDEGFLNEARKNGKVVTINQKDGSIYTGLISAFDSNTLLFLDPRQVSPVLLFKHSIVNISLTA